MKRAAFDTVAAVDLGSNSFHMVVATDVHGHLHVLDRLRERVALAEGLSAENELDPAVASRALDCLRRFGQRLRFMPHPSVRAVGTSTLRKVGDRGKFLARAERALGHHIEIVSGAEEARLVYLGVAHHAPHVRGRRFVVDIGGGSTEIIVGQGFEVRELASLDMGCVSWTRRFFPNEKLTAGGFERAELQAQLELRAVKRRLLALGWEQTLGSSGTVRAIASILAERDKGSGSITQPGLDWLRDRIIAAKQVKRIALPGMGIDRQPVIAGGVAILRAVFRTFRIKRMEAASGALREGVLFDLLGRIHHEDVRDRTIRALCQKHRVDEEQAARVERTALALFESTQRAWDLEEDEGRRLLSWAARLHEIGLSIAYSGYHRHGAYLVANGEMPGFSEEEKQVLAAIIGGHRSKPDPTPFAVLGERREELAKRLCALLRVAGRLHRSRAARALPRLRTESGRSSLTIEFPSGWLERHLLTRTDLIEEAERLDLLGLRLRIR